MKKTSFLVLFLLILIFSNTAFASPSISSTYDQLFQTDQATTALHDISITEGSEEPFIAAGSIKITIPNNLKMIFNVGKTEDELAVSGSAVDNGKVASSPDISFENGDKTLVIPIGQDFASGEQLVVANAYVEGFHSIPSNYEHLILQVNGAETQYLDDRYINIESSTNKDTSKPDVPANFAVTDNEDGDGVKITWTDPTDLDLQLINIYRGVNEYPISGTIYTSVGVGIEEYIDTDVEIGDTVKYALKSIDQDQNLSRYTDELSFTVGETLPVVEPTVPQNISLEETEEGHVKISWDPLSQTIQIFKTSYLESYPEEYYVQLENNTSGEYTDTGTEEEKTYLYKLKSLVNDEYSDFSEEYSITTSVIYCTAEYTPVCGADGATYTNSCVANKNDVEISHTGECEEEEQFCTAEYDPVCGADGLTYTNQCVAEKNSIEIASQGECAPQPQPAAFADISGNWAKTEIEAMTEVKVMYGRGDGTTFDPSSGLNRAEAAAMLYRVLSLGEPTAPETSLFTDVAVDAWYAGYVMGLKDLSLVDGKTSTTFVPGEVMNRAEFLQMAMNVYYYLTDTELVATEVTDIFTDVSASSWYALVVTEAYEKGFVGGKTATTFAPGDPITRAETAKILYNMFYELI